MNDQKAFAAVMKQLAAYYGRAELSALALDAYWTHVGHLPADAWHSALMAHQRKSREFPMVSDLLTEIDRIDAVERAEQFDLASADPERLSPRARQVITEVLGDLSALYTPAGLRSLAKDENKFQRAYYKQQRAARAVAAPTLRAELVKLRDEFSVTEAGEALADGEPVAQPAPGKGGGG